MEAINVWLDGRLWKIILLGLLCLICLALGPLGYELSGLWNNYLWMAGSFFGFLAGAAFGVLLARR